jgi:hypothetical protein
MPGARQGAGGGAADAARWVLEGVLCVRVLRASLHVGFQRLACLGVGAC